MCYYIPLQLLQRVHKRTTKLSEYAFCRQCFIPPWSCSRWKSVNFAHSANWASVIYHKTQWLLLFDLYLNACQGQQRKPLQPFCFEEQYKILDRSYIGRGFLTWTPGWRKLVICKNQDDDSKNVTLIWHLPFISIAFVCLFSLQNLEMYDLYKI